MAESSFAADEARRAQQESEAALRKSIGYQGADGNALHGHARTEAAQAARKALADAAKGEPLEAGPTGKVPDIEVAINQPHTATARGNKLAITIVDPPQGQVFDLKNALVYDTDETTVLKTGAPIVVQIDDPDSPGDPLLLNFALYKIEWCNGSTPGTRYALMSEFVAD